MKKIPVLALCSFWALTVSGFAQETAYQALHVVGQVKGQPFLDHLLNLEGLAGNSQPGSWRLIFEDAGSRAGLREIEVRGGEIISQRTPLKSSFTDTSLVNLDRLQLDSDGAFTVSEREAGQQGIRFATANYLLQSDGDTGTPVWRVELLDSSGSIVQTLRISADNGSVVAGPKTPLRNDDVEKAPRGGVSLADQPDDGSDTPELKVRRTVVRSGRTVKNSFKHIAGSLQQIFTGRRTIDKNLPEE